MLSLSKHKGFSTYYVYLIRCLDGSYYIGFTHNLQKRMQEHKGGYGSKHSSERGINDLLYYETFQSKTEALEREKQLKGWSRAKKEALMTGDKDQLRKLSLSNENRKGRFS